MQGYVFIDKKLGKFIGFGVEGAYTQLLIYVYQSKSLYAVFKNGFQVGLRAHECFFGELFGGDIALQGQKA